MSELVQCAKARSNQIKENRLIRSVKAYKPEYCSLLLAHLESGWSFGSFGGKIGVQNDVLYVWRKNFKEFDEIAKKYKRKRADYNFSFS